jgi:hypothetical protein
MSKEKIQELRLKHLDLFKNDNSKFDLFVQSMDSDYLKIKKHLKSMKDEEHNRTFVFKNFELWGDVVEGLKSIEFPTHKTKKKIDGKWISLDQKRYSYEKEGKEAFKFKLFISDFLEAKAMVDSPSSPKNRYSMLKTELIKYLSNEKPRDILPVDPAYVEELKVEKKIQREEQTQQEEEIIEETQLDLMIAQEEEKTITRLPTLEDGVEHMDKNLHPDLHDV